MRERPLLKGFFRLGVVLFVIIWLGCGTWLLRYENNNLYLVWKHFSPYLTYAGGGPMFFGNEWCSIIAKDDFLSRPESDRIIFAERFFTKEIEPLAGLYGWDVKKLKDWFIKISSNVENIPIKEFHDIKYRDIDLSKMPHRNISHNFFGKDNWLMSIIIFLVIYLPILIVFFTVRWVYLGFKKKGSDKSGH